MEYPKISVILPLYNVEKYITACIESIITQDYPNIEIVVVDDGSTDNSRTVAESLLKHSGREYRVISRPNKGVSATRNDGIKACTGEWLVMVDADDIVDKSFVSILYENLDKKNNSCVVFSNYRIVGADSIGIVPLQNGETRIFERSEALEKFQKREVKFIVAAMLINTQFIIENDIFFDEDCRYSEDVVYIWKILCRMTEVRFVDIPLYDYLVRSCSTMTSSNLEKILTCRDAILRLYENYISSIENMDEFKKNFLCRYFLAITHSAAKLLSYQNFKELMEELNIDNYLKIKGRGRSGKVLLLIGVYYFCPRLFYLILRKK